MFQVRTFLRRIVRLNCHELLTQKSFFEIELTEKLIEKLGVCGNSLLVRQKKKKKKERKKERKKEEKIRFLAVPFRLITFIKILIV